MSRVREQRPETETPVPSSPGSRAPGWSAGGWRRTSGTGVSVRGQNPRTDGDSLHTGSGELIPLPGLPAPLLGTQGPRLGEQRSGPLCRGAGDGRCGPASPGARVGRAGGPRGGTGHPRAVMTVKLGHRGGRPASHGAAQQRAREAQRPRGHVSNPSQTGRVPGVKRRSVILTSKCLFRFNQTFLSFRQKTQIQGKALLLRPGLSAAGPVSF